MVSLGRSPGVEISDPRLSSLDIFFFEAFGDCYLEWLLPIYIPTFRHVGDSLSSRRSPAFIAYRLVRMVSLTGGA